MNGWLVFLGLVAAYGVFFYAAGVRKLVPGFEPVGPLLLWKTQAGVVAMDKLARWRRFWAVFGDLGIVATVTMGALMLLLLVLQLVAFASDPVTISENAPPPITLVGLPGVNPIIPLWWGVIGLVVALVVHEGAHGVLARLAGMRVKSTGLLLCVVPVGAFVEPDEHDVERSTIRARNRVFAAGPWSNLVVAILAGALFSSVFVSAMVPPTQESGVTVTQVFAGTAADEAGLAPGDRILSMTGPFGPAPGANATAEGEPSEGGNATAPNATAEAATTVRFTDQEGFSAALNRTEANETYALTYARGGERFTVDVTLGDRHAAVQRDGEAPEWMRGKGFLGVSTLDGAVLSTLRDALADPFAKGGLGLFFFYPLFVFTNRIDILNAPYAGFFDVQGPLAALPPALFFALANVLYWVFWLNLMLGTFNALPAGPLDGGQMFRATLREALWRRFGVDRARVALEPGPGERGLFARGVDDETQAKLDRAQHVLRRVTMSLGLFILAMILLPLVAPKLVEILL